MYSNKVKPIKHNIAASIIAFLSVPASSKLFLSIFTSIISTTLQNKQHPAKIFTTISMSINLNLIIPNLSLIQFLFILIIS